MNVVTRAEWDARSPEGPVYTVPWASRTEFFVHHTTGPTTQTVRSIQAFHQGPQRGWADVGYNFLVDDRGRLFEGRGWLAVGAHCPGHNRSGVSVAYIGDNSPSPAALRAIRWLYEEACRRAGRKLRMLGHGDRYATACPGPRLAAWVDDGMPVDTPKPARPAAPRRPELQPGDSSPHVIRIRKALGAANQTSRDYTPEDYDLMTLVTRFKAKHKLGTGYGWTAACWAVLDKENPS
ncbi:N-acetylmuramoyl-L-alanine amidase [Nonomuraea sp. NPDC050328]|uniref:N-acetylmuramoyl-L-alanine amidase n=1 Tax=Nonomuraea sp. NPDC050328 TaxID=3364361 RepID=UPI0037895832